MMTQELGFSVLSAPLAAIDRRVLSQAWYSALHLAHDRPLAKSGLAKNPAVRAARRAPLPNEQRARPSVDAKTEARVCRDVAPRRRMDEDDRRSIRSPLARKIERAFLHPMRSPQSASFALGGGGKVHVTLRKGRGGLHLVAVCAPAARDAVAKALEQARYALAVRGITLNASLSRSDAAW